MYLYLLPIFVPHKVNVYQYTIINCVTDKSLIHHFIPFENDNTSVHDNNILFLDISLLKIRRRPSKYGVWIGGCFGFFGMFGFFNNETCRMAYMSILVRVDFEVPTRNENGKKMSNMKQSKRKRYIYICIHIIYKCKIHILNFKSIF